MIAVSPAGSAIVQFRPIGATTFTAEVTVAPGSLHVMTRPARWEHQVKPVKQDRILKRG